MGGPRRRLLPRAEVHSRAEDLPERLQWFKWEAYTTWLSGFALFCVLYYVDADLNLVGADMSEWAAIAISLALLAAAWLVYDVLCRVIDNELVLPPCSSRL